MEREAGGAPWTTLAAREKGPSDHLGDLGLAGDLQEFGPWEEADRAGCVRVKGTAHRRLPGSWAREVSAAPSRM